MAKLLDYVFEIVYRSGASNKVTNALSRKLEDKEEEDKEEEEKELRVIAKPFWQEF